MSALPCRTVFPVTEIEVTDEFIRLFDAPCAWSSEVRHCYAVAVTEWRRARDRQDIRMRAERVVLAVLGTDPTPAGIVLALEHAGLLLAPVVPEPEVGAS